MKHLTGFDITEVTQYWVSSRNCMKIRIENNLMFLF